MKTFLIRLVILALVAYMIQWVVYVAVKNTLDKKSKFRMTRFYRNKQHDYFVLGNSRAVNSINEKHANQNLKLDLINLAFNGEPYSNISDMLDEINYSNKNSVIYIEITGLTSSNTDDSYTYYMSNSKFIKKRYQQSIYNKISILRLNNELFLRNIYYLSKSDDDWINGSTITQNLIEQVNSSKAFSIIENKTEFMNRLFRIKNKCDTAGNKLILFLAPYLPQYLKKATDYNDVKMLLSNNKENFNFIDLNNITLQANMYADRVHTNSRGSTILTDTLISLTSLN